MNDSSLQSLLHTGQRARLIPTVKDSKKEERATSALLATFRVVPSYAEMVLSNVGVSVSKRSKISCFTEISFNNKDKKYPRPDGLIIVSTGSKNWSAIVESKIGNHELKLDQIEQYIDVAKNNGIDALITISNEFATVPTHHPILVQKHKLKNIQIYHFSWLFLQSTAILLNENKGVTDPEQAFILSELIRYFQHPESGVTAFTKMDSGWKEVCQQIQEGRKLRQNDKNVENSVGSWQQLLRYISITLSVKIGKAVSIYLSRSRADDPSLSFKDDLEELVQKNSLSAEFDIPNAASRLKVVVDFLRRTVNFSMHLDAPKDRKLASASINWLLRQIDHLKESDIILTVDWPKRIPTTGNRLSAVFQDVECLIPEGIKDIPTSFELKQVNDLASKFKGAVTFVEIVANSLPKFYEDVGQHLYKWMPKPPKVKSADKQASDIETLEEKKEEIVNPFWLPPN